MKTSKASGNVTSIYIETEKDGYKRKCERHIRSTLSENGNKTRFRVKVKRTMKS